MKRRIALLSEHASPLAALGGAESGGQNVYVGQIARHLAMLGLDVDIFTRRDSSQLPEIVQWGHGVRIVHVPAGPTAFVPKEALLPLMPEFTAYLLRFCERQRQPYDLIHANFWLSGLVAADVKQAIGTPFVVTFHALARAHCTPFGQGGAAIEQRIAIESRVVREADRLIALSPQEEEDLIGLYQADPQRIALIPPAIAPTEFWPIGKAHARLTLGLPLDERLILQLGRMVPRKGVDNAIRGFARLVHEHGIAARLIVVGGEAPGSDTGATLELGRLQMVAREEGVADRVSFMGRRSRDELKYFYSAADCFVTTPQYEPFGTTPLEAMACGTPVIGSNVGGIRFTVRDGETGFLVPPDNPVALADRMATLFHHPEISSRFSQQGPARIKALFTWERVAASMHTLYGEVLADMRARLPARGDQLALIESHFEGLVTTLLRARRRLRPSLLEGAALLNGCLEGGHKVLVCGNGGSAAEAQHFAGELVGRFKYPDRAGLPVLSLTADTAIMTAWANDYSYADVFARQVSAYGQPGDTLVGISTSGHSRNVIQAFEVARRLGMRTLAILGRDGGDLRQLADVAIVVPSNETQHIQEVHLLIIHLLCELVEEEIMARQAGRPLARPSLRLVAEGGREGAPPEPVPAAERPTVTAKGDAS